MAAGRPSEYNPEFVEQVRKLCLLGATDAELADFFEVCEATLNNWKNAHPEFLESIKSGKRIADAEVAQKLYGRAIGSEWTEEAAIKVKTVHYENGKRSMEEEKVVTIPVKCAAPPDTTACIFWLKNRKSSDWRDKQDIAVTGTLTVNVLDEILNGDSDPQPAAESEDTQQPD